MKAGDKVYCYKNFTGYKSRITNNKLNGVYPIIYNSGQYYTIENIFHSETSCHKIEIKSGDLNYLNTTYWFFYYNDEGKNKPFFSKYFYTQQELRKQKICKLTQTK